MSGVWSEEEIDGLRLLRGRSSDIEVALLPDVGGKMISLRSPSGREWLWQTPRRPYRKPEYGGAFEAYDISGFDECFPGIGEGPYPLAPWEGVGVPDHGEVWTLPWDVSFDTETLVLAVHGVRFPYRLEKRLTLDGSGVRIDYRLENLSPFTLRYLWSAHPLFAVRPGMRVELPPGVGVRTDWSNSSRLGELGTKHAWPVTHNAAGTSVTLDVLPALGAGTADKVYTDRLTVTGQATTCRLVDPDTGEYVGFRSDPVEVPYVGLWLNMDGWPLSGETCFNVALEPCTGYPDRLDLAIERDEAATLGPRSVNRWTLHLEVGVSERADA
jgi:galactose mutarotase-like enzyme